VKLWGIVDGVYRLRGPGQAWLRGLLQLLQPELERGLGMGAYFFDARASPAFVTSELTAVGVSDQELALIGQILQQTQSPNERTRRVLALRDGCGTASEIMTRRLFRSMPSLDALSRASKIRDFFGLIATDASGLGCVVNVCLPAETTTTAAVRRRWGRVAAHIAAALRLRRAMASVTAGEGDASSLAEAIFDDRGRLQHLAPAVYDAAGREQLARGVRRRERARARLHRLDPDDAVAEWSALVAGRWSLVDEVESDGRRFVIAHRNPVAVPPLARLTREQASVLGLALLGHSNKLIAYELGISEASVAMRLGRAGRTLGATSRVALLRRVSELLGRER